MLEAFRALRLSLCKYCSLNVPMSSDELVLHTDASFLRFGCVLNVESETLPIAL